MKLPHTSKQVIFDIETDGLLDEVSKLHCIAFKWGTDPVQLVKQDGVGTLLGEFTAPMTGPKAFIGHNILAYDIPALCKLYPVAMSRVLNPNDVFWYDTHVLTSLFYPDLAAFDLKNRGTCDLPPRLIGSHSLEAWGYRLGVLKGEYGKTTDWSEYTEEMGEYCRQDVVVTEALWKHLQENFDLSAPYVKLEHDFAECCNLQTHHGVYFDKAAANSLMATLVKRRLEIDCKYSKLGLEQPYVTPVLKQKKIKRVRFNPGSRDHVAKLLQDREGWVPTEFTDGGKPKVDETTLTKFGTKTALEFAERFMLQKRIGMVGEGRYSWLNCVESDSRIRGRIIHNGTPTARCTHSSPNLGQVPSTRAEYGKECRSLFTVPPGARLVGADAKGLELRCLGHYLAEFDGGAYARTVVESDPHLLTMQLADVDDRDVAKTIIYALIYGASDTKLGSVVQGDRFDGLRIRRSLLKGIDGLEELMASLDQKYDQDGFLVGLDGRPIPVRKHHALLNTALQSCGAIAMKYAVVLLNDILLETGNARQVLFVHDEIQVEVLTPVSDSDLDAGEVADCACECIVAAGEHFNMRVPLAGEAKIGLTWADTH